MRPSQYRLKFKPTFLFYKLKTSDILIYCPEYDCFTFLYFLPLSQLAPLILKLEEHLFLFMLCSVRSVSISGAVQRQPFKCHHLYCSIHGCAVTSQSCSQDICSCSLRSCELQCSVHSHVSHAHVHGCVGYHWWDYGKHMCMCFISCNEQKKCSYA